MSRFFNEHPELAEEIARLPMSQQNAAIRSAMSASYDPDAIRDRYEEQQRERVHHHRPLNTSPGGEESHPSSLSSGSASPGEDFRCDVCGAPPGKHHLSYCDLRGDV